MPTCDDAQVKTGRQIRHHYYIPLEVKPSPDGLMIAAKNGCAAAVRAVLGAGGAYRLRVYQQAMAEAAEAEAVVLCTIDWDQGEVRVQGSSVVPLDRCRFIQTKQMTSSAPALLLDAGGHRLMLLAGNPFGISIHGLVALLEEQGVRIEKTWFAF